MNILRVLCILLVSLVFYSESPAQAYVVIVNKRNPVEVLNKKHLSDLFLKKTDWDDHIMVEPVDLPAKSLVRDSFTREIHGKSVSAIRSYWQQAVFMGTASVPPEMKNDSEVIEFVKKTPSAIGYVSLSANVEEVKVVKVVKVK